MTIAKIADQIGQTICLKAGRETETAKVCYGVECALVLVISVGIILTVGAILGVLRETFGIAMVFLVMKYIVGGSHLSGFSRCVIYSALIIVGAAIFLKTPNSRGVPLWIFGLMLMGGLAVIYKYAPLIREGIKLNRRQIWSRRFFAAVILLGFIFINSFHISAGWWSGLVGTALALFNITPPGVGLVKLVERLTKPKGGEIQ